MRKRPRGARSANSGTPTSGVGVTSEILATLREDVLREQVLDPLFRAMPYLHVKYHHGGVLERGADFLLWETAPTGRTKCIAVVVKARDLNGAVSATNGPGEVRTQLDQAFGTAFTHPTSLEKMYPSECWVVVGGRIDKNAKAAIEPLLQTRAPFVTWLEGADILRLLSQYRCAPAALAHLQNAQDILQQSAPAGYAISTTGHSSGAMLVGVHPHPGAKPDGIPFSITLQQPPGPDGEQQLHTAVRSILFGGEVTSDSGVLASWTPPAMVAALLPAGETLKSFSIEAIPRPLARVVDLRAMAAAEELGRWASVLVDVVAPIAGATSIRARPEGEILRFELTFLQARATFALRVRREEESSEAVDAARTLASMRFLLASMRADRLEVVDTRSGILVTTIPIGPRTVPETPPGLLEFYERADLLQKQLGVRVALPVGDIPEDFVATVMLLSDVLAGRAPTDQIYEAEYPGSLTPTDAAALLAQDAKDALIFQQDVAFSARLGGWVIAVPLRIIFAGGRLCDATRARLTAIVEAATDTSAPCTVRVIPHRGHLQRTFAQNGPVTTQFSPPERAPASAPETSGADGPSPP